MSTQTDAYNDVVELCALLQCLGFSVKSLENNDRNLSQDAGVRTVAVNCQTSGLHVVLESNGVPSCSCPDANHHQNSGMWQVSGMAGGKQLDKEFGSSLIGCLPTLHRERLTKELRDIMRYIKANNESDILEPNKSASMIELTSPDNRDMNILKAETPTRYRSLDTLTAMSPLLPTFRQSAALGSSADKDDRKHRSMCRRQSTYTISSGSNQKIPNKTSSPIQPQTSVLEKLIEAEKDAELLRLKLSTLVKEYSNETKNDSSMSSLALDVSKISVFKGPDFKGQFSSSPNLSSIGLNDDNKRGLKKYESVSTSNLGPNTQNKEAKPSKLRRISPNIFKLKRDSLAKSDKNKVQENKPSKLNGLFRPKLVTPVRIPRLNPEASPTLSASKKKYSHVKSTIPRPASAKKE